MTPEEYSKKYRYFRMIYVAEDGEWIDGKEVLRRLDKTHYPTRYMEPRLASSEAPVDDDITAIRIVDKVFTAYKLRGEVPINDALVRYMIRGGRHKPKGTEEPVYHVEVDPENPAWGRKPKTS